MHSTDIHARTRRYETLVHHSIRIGHSSLSPLHWTAISWLAGVILAVPFLPKLSHHLDHGYHQPFILAAATALGSFICLLTGFFNTTLLFPIYIALITAAITASSAVHTRHLALTVRALGATTASSRMSLSATALGSFATALIALFTCHMLRRADHLTSLWVVSIFSGLKWFIGFTETFFSNRPGPPPSSSLAALAANHCPQLIGRLIAVFLSSFSSTCMFVGATLYVMGSLCMRPALILALWMSYFLFAAAALPALHAVHLLVRVDPVKMNLFGFMLSAIAAGSGFYFGSTEWRYTTMIFASLVQSLGAGVLHAFGRVMVVEQSAEGKEGVAAAWYEWARMAGACAGFALAAVSTEDVKRSFGTAFLGVFVGVVVLIFGGDVREFGGRGRSRSEGESSENVDQSGEYIGEKKKPGKRAEVTVQV